MATGVQPFVFTPVYVMGTYIKRIFRDVFSKQAIFFKKNGQFCVIIQKKKTTKFASLLSIVRSIMKDVT